jgi:hypothetical protein
MLAPNAMKKADPRGARLFTGTVIRDQQRCLFQIDEAALLNSWAT